jgi:hypothetical protein
VPYLTHPVLPAGAVGLLAAPSRVAHDWLDAGSRRSTLAPALVIVACGAVYGAAMGAWRDPMLALYVAIKLPVLLLATAAVDALANGVWARWFGLELSLERSLRAVLMAFALASIVLAALAPVVLLFALTLPNGDDDAARTAHDVLGLFHVGALALAGTVAVRRQAAWIEEISPNARGVRAAVGFWLVINLVVGAHISWNLRPWFGSPWMQTVFLRERPFDGTFYESMLRMILHQ